MHKIKLVFFLFITSVMGQAQQEVRTIANQSIPIKTTNVAVATFKLSEVKTAYDLALNLSYFHHVSNLLKSEYLILPVVTMDGKPIFEEDLKKMKIEDIASYSFSSGIETIALYGSRGQYGHLLIQTQKSITNENDR